MTTLTEQIAAVTAIAHALLVATGRARSPATVNMRLKTLAKIEEGEG